MKLTLKNIRQLKRDSESPLMKRVCNYVIDEWSNYDDKVCIFKDVLYYGCQSGTVGFLIWYTQTTAFYKQYRPCRDRQQPLQSRLSRCYLHRDF